MNLLKVVLALAVVMVAAQAFSSTPGFQATDSFGSVNPTKRTCPTGGIAGGVCWTLPVSNCSHVADYTGYAKVLHPAGKSLGTVVLIVGGSGVGIWEQYYDNTDNIPVGLNTINALLGSGLTTVEVSFGTPFVSANGQAWETGPGGIRAASCRFGTIAWWTFFQIHNADQS